MTAVRVYHNTGEHRPTHIHLIFSEEHGYTRKNFECNQRCVTTNLLLECEVPRPWTKQVNLRKINSSLDAFFNKYIDTVSASGSGALEHFQEHQ